LIITLVFEKNANCFRRKWAKIAEDCDHNIDPCSVSNLLFVGPVPTHLMSNAIYRIFKLQ
jgi:hypothetical protein